MGEVHRLLTEQGKEHALRGDLNRSVVEAASSYLADEMAGLSIVYSGWCHAALPHKRLADDAIWALQSEHCTLLVEPGHRITENGKPLAVGVPYGSRARLILTRIIHEKCAVKAKPLISFTTMRMGCLVKFFAMKSLAQVFGGLGRFRAVR